MSTQTVRHEFYVDGWNTKLKAADLPGEFIVYSTRVKLRGFSNMQVVLQHLIGREEDAAAT